MLSPQPFALALSASTPAPAIPAGPQLEDVSGSLSSLFDMLMNGGPLMIPIGLCSIISLAYIVERSVRLANNVVGNTSSFRRSLVEGVRQGGPMRGLQLCNERKKQPFARVFAAGFKRADAPAIEVDQAVEDAGGREVRKLSSNLRPLLVVGMIAPLLGLLGTVWGMIQAFSNIAGQEALGKPELLAEGISQALITTAAGLAVAIPTQAAYYWYRGKIERFVRSTEDTYEELYDALQSHRRTGEAA